MRGRDAAHVAPERGGRFAGENLLFTPGVYRYASTIAVTRADTKVIGLGFATIIPTAGQTTISVADVSGVDISILDDAWAWRADHGAGTGSWTSDTAATGLTVNGGGVTSDGLAVEHFQKYETVWNGQGGRVVFFQNENPYEVPNQASWMASPTQNGYPAFYLPNSVTSFQGYGMGSYSYFDQGVAIQNAMAFQAPNSSGVVFHDILTVWLNGSGGIQSVINRTGAPVTSTAPGPSNIVTYG